MSKQQTQSNGADTTTSERYSYPANTQSAQGNLGYGHFIRKRSILDSQAKVTGFTTVIDPGILVDHHYRWYYCLCFNAAYLKWDLGDEAVEALRGRTESVFGQAVHDGVLFDWYESAMELPAPSVFLRHMRTMGLHQIIFPDHEEEWRWNAMLACVDKLFKKDKMYGLFAFCSAEAIGKSCGILGYDRADIAGFTKVANAVDAVRTAPPAKEATLLLKTRIASMVIPNAPLIKEIIRVSGVEFPEGWPAELNKKNVIEGRILTGDDLIKAGFEPGEHFAKILDHCYAVQKTRNMRPSNRSKKQLLKVARVLILRGSILTAH